VVKAVSKAADLTGSYGAKALVAAGSVPVAQPFDGINEIPRRTSFVQDVLAGAGRVKQISETDRYTYWAQTVRTFAAAPVSPGSVKPTSTLTVERREGQAQVVAHLSEALSETDLADNNDLRGFVDAEMFLGLQSALASQIVNGNGQSGAGGLPVANAPNLQGMRLATGVQTHNRGGDSLLVAYRKARTKLELQDVPLDGMVYLIHPNDGRGPGLDH
jgi:hypothetical protein